MIDKYRLVNGHKIQQFMGLWWESYGYLEKFKIPVKDHNGAIRIISMNYFPSWEIEYTKTTELRQFAVRMGNQFAKEFKNPLGIGLAYHTAFQYECDGTLLSDLRKANGIKIKPELITFLEYYAKHSPIEIYVTDEGNYRRTIELLTDEVKERIAEDKKSSEIDPIFSVDHSQPINEVEVLYWDLRDDKYIIHHSDGENCEITEEIIDSVLECIKPDAHDEAVFGMIRFGDNQNFSIKNKIVRDIKEYMVNEE